MPQGVWITPGFEEVPHFAKMEQWTRNQTAFHERSANALYGRGKSIGESNHAFGFALSQLHPRLATCLKRSTTGSSGSSRLSDPINCGCQASHTSLRCKADNTWSLWLLPMRLGWWVAVKAVPWTQTLWSMRWSKLCTTDNLNLQMHWLITAIRARNTYLSGTTSDWARRGSSLRWIVVATATANRWRRRLTVYTKLSWFSAGHLGKPRSHWSLQRWNGRLG